MGPRSGIRVVDLSLFLPGPMLTMMMADQGAEVIKVGQSEHRLDGLWFATQHEIAKGVMT